MNHSIFQVNLFVLLLILVKRSDQYFDSVFSDPGDDDHSRCTTVNWGTYENFLFCGNSKKLAASDLLKSVETDLNLSIHQGLYIMQYADKTLPANLLENVKLKLFKLTSSNLKSILENDIAGRFEIINFVECTSLTFVHQQAFAKQSNLTQLILRKNKYLSFLSLNLSQSKDLSLIDLSMNNLTTMSAPLLHPDVSHLTVDIAANKLHCDCNLDWIASRAFQKHIKKPLSEGIRFQCDLPERHRGKSATADFLAKMCIDCFKEPCKSCELCKNNGTCSDTNSSYTCICESGYTGPDCSILQYRCKADTCENNGTCIDGRDNYTCACAPGYGGQNCGTFVGYKPGLCENGGTCIESKGSYMRECALGFTGQSCEHALTSSTNQNESQTGRMAVTVASIFLVVTLCCLGLLGAIIYRRRKRASEDASLESSDDKACEESGAENADADSGSFDITVAEDSSCYYVKVDL